MDLAIIGTGFVGLTSAVVYASKGHNVIGVDVDRFKVDNLNQGICLIHEDQVGTLLYDGLEKGNLSFTTDLGKAINSSDIVIITVGTPPRKNGSSDLSYLFKAVDDVASLAKKDLILVIKSTVPVGTCREVMSIVKKSPHNIEVVSNPEFLAEGTAVADTLSMSRLVVGSDSERAIQVILDLHKGMTDNYVVTDLESAELIKHASNAFLATKISFMNGIAKLCEFYGGNVDEVARGMGMDSRIGNQFLKAGLGFGGSCFPKDVLSLRNMSDGVSNNLYTLLSGVLSINNENKYDIAFKLEELMNSQVAGRKVAVLGLSFKPNTNDIREAPSLIIINSLLALGADVHVYDPAVTETEIRDGLMASGYRDHIKYRSSITDVLAGAEGAVIVTEWDQIKELGAKAFVKLMKTPNVADGRGVLDPKEAREQGINLYSIGRN
ncbi:UDP-glucose dehydrogenase [Bacillus phage SP-15]|uniref:UDP-glucose 6-dehydrogenase n=1 Tax=Bacillus phage SP-15 TaxID=1792032 RepID=A0A127AXI2_9CAUD|nr:UDP-glucose dehydrogenase [Bacillus phage SP-15]AMM44944.1 UDP-glucose dehydrogenase [Bacillus phage SP-15]